MIILTKEKDKNKKREEYVEYTEFICKEIKTKKNKNRNRKINKNVTKNVFKNVSKNNFKNVTKNVTNDIIKDDELIKQAGGELNNIIESNVKNEKQINIKYDRIIKNINELNK